MATFEERSEIRIDILPTGKCFDDALDYLGRLVKDNPEEIGSPSYKLVHAVCNDAENPALGEFAHAWVEYGTECIFAGVIGPGHELSGQSCWLHAEMESFYMRLRPCLIKKYSIKSALMENEVSGHYGPWDEEIRKHTKEGKTAK